MSQTTAAGPNQSNKHTSINDYVQDLKSPDAARRRRAVIALGKTGDLAALKPLSEVFHNDASVELRELARQAGLFIRHKADKSGPDPATERKLRVTEADVLRAKGYTEQALTLNLEGDNARAVQSLYKALVNNPALISDTYFTGIAASVLNVSAEEAIAVLRDAQQRGEFAKTDQLSRHTAEVEQHMEEARRFTIEGLSLDLALYLLICTLGPVMMILVVTQSVQQLLTQGASATEGMPNVLAELETVVRVGTSYSALMVIVIASAVGGLINLLTQTGLIHVIVRYLLHGKGTFAYLLSKVVPLLARYLLVVFIVSSLAIGVGVGGGAFFLVYIAGFGLGLFSLLTLIKLAGQIGKAYHVGAGAGCVSILLASIGLGVLNAIMSSVLSQILAALLSRFVTPT